MATGHLDLCSINIHVFTIRRKEKWRRVKGYFREEERQDPNKQLHAGFLLGLYFDSEEGGDMLFRNVSRFSTDYTALYPTL
jgi:hypothetical protein